MQRRIMVGFSAAALLAACQLSAPAGVPAFILPATSPLPVSSMPVSVETPNAPAAAAQSTPTAPTPTPKPRVYLGIAFDGPRGLAVGQTALLQAVDMTGKLPRGRAVTWRLDAASMQRAHFVAQDGSTCTVAVTAPGAVHVTVSAEEEDGEILLAGVATPAPGTLDPAFGSVYPGGSPRPRSGAYVIRSEREWIHYWEVSEYESRFEGSSASPPSPPSVDWRQESLVLLADTSTGGDAPVLCAVDSSGLGRITAVLPDVRDTRAPDSAATTTYLRVYHVPKLPATTVVDYTCIDEKGRPAGCMTALPDPDPFYDLSGQVLTVGRGVDLPVGWTGAPLRWSLGTRTAARARLDGNRLLPLAPGGLVLEARAGDRVGYVFNAVQGGPALTSTMIDPYFLIGIRGFTKPAVVSDEARWQRIWANLWLPGGSAGGPAPGEPFRSPPPRPQEAPTINFPDRSVLLVDLDLQSYQGALPVVTSIVSGAVQVVVPDVRLPGHTDPFAPPSPSSAGPVPVADSRRVRGLRTIMFDLPALPPEVTVMIEPFTEAADVR